MFFVNFKFLSVDFDFKVGGKMVSVLVAGGVAGAWDFLTICNTTLEALESCLMTGGLGPPGVVGLLLVGRTGSVGLSRRLIDGLSKSTVRLAFDFDVSWGGTKKIK